MRVCAVDDVEAGSARRVDVDGHRLAIVRLPSKDAGKPDDFYAIGDRCSHEDYSLSEGDVWEDEREIECPKHGSTFSLVHRRAADAARDAPGARLRRCVSTATTCTWSCRDDASSSRTCTPGVSGVEVLRGVDLDRRVG